MLIAVGQEAAAADDKALWRRVPNWPHWTIFDENLGRLRPSSIAFEDHRNGTAMSAFLEDHGNTIAEVLNGHESFGLAAIKVGLVRSQGLKIFHAPLPSLPSHVEVHGPKPKRVMSALAKAAVWLVEPTLKEE